MPTYTVREQLVSAITGTTGSFLSREAAVAGAIGTITGPTGVEVHIQQCTQIAASGPTGTYLTTFNTLGPLTGATFNATTREDATNQAVAAAPTGPGAGVSIWSAA